MSVDVNEEDRKITFPVAETFVAPQGEATWAGTMMQFIRLAGCTVGKQFTTEDRATKFQMLNNYQTKCTAWNGVEFACDTDYRQASKLTIEDILQIVKESGVSHVCLTGGEPVMHPKLPLLVEYLIDSGLNVHIETSGTLPLRSIRAVSHREKQLWITVSPKNNYMVGEIDSCANEIKILIDDTIKSEDIKCLINTFPSIPIWVQPINGETSINQYNVEQCLSLMREFPQLRLSIQLHKVIGTR